MAVIGCTLRALHVDSDRICACVGRRRRVEGAEELKQIAWEGRPLEIRTGDEMARKLAYGNHRSGAKYGGKELANEAANVAFGRAIVFPITLAKDIVGLRIFPIRVKEEKEKHRVIHESTLRGNEADEWKVIGMREREATLEIWGWSVNADTDWEQVPKYLLVGVMRETIARCLGEVCNTEANSCKTMDTKSSFWFVGVVFGGAAAFEYRLWVLLLVDLLRLQFGLRGSPGWSGMVARAIQEARHASTWVSVGGGRSCEELRGHCGTDRKGRGAVASGELGAMVTRWRERGPRVTHSRWVSS